MKSTIAVLGCFTNNLPIGLALLSVAMVTKLGSKPAALSTWRNTLTEIAMGNTVAGWGFTITALPVAKLAIMDGQAFQVGKLAQEKQTATPRGTNR